MSDVEKRYEAPEPTVAKFVESEEGERQLGDADSVYEAKLVRKLDLFIIPVVMLLYLLSFLDRYVFKPATLYNPYTWTWPKPTLLRHLRKYKHLVLT